MGEFGSPEAGTNMHTLTEGVYIKHDPSLYPGPLHKHCVGKLVRCLKVKFRTAFNL